MATIDRSILEHDHGDWRAHVAMIAEELRLGFEAVDKIPRPAVTVFGSARIDRGDGEYEHARECGRGLAEAGFAVVTGGGVAARSGRAGAAAWKAAEPVRQRPRRAGSRIRTRETFRSSI